MSQMTMTIRDGRRAIHSDPHGSFAEAAIAALSAEPETIEEFEAALERFVPPDRRHPLSCWSPGVCDEPYDAGVCVIDLAARLVVLQSTYSSPGKEGDCSYHVDANRVVYLRYHLSDDWEFAEDLDGWECRADRRRRERLARPPIDTRAALYGEAAGFIVAECLAARGDAPSPGSWSPPPGWVLRVLPERAKPDQPPTAEDGVAEIHARWLMTPREDLGGRTPRDVLLEKRDFIDWDLQHRCEQWSRLGACPPPLDRESAAYRFAGFGTHENVVYYEMLRHLIWDCWEHVVRTPGGEVPPPRAAAEEVARLKQVQEEWLNAPEAEDLGGHTPAAVIDHERARIPEAGTGRDAMIDDDCPLCQMMAEDMGPFFWHLDGCNMDPEFPFTRHRTREEWEEEERRRREFNEEFNRRREERERRRAETGEELPLWDDDLPDLVAGEVDSAEDSSIWKRTLAGPGGGGPLSLFDIGAFLAELGCDLKEQPETASRVEALNRHFGNLREAARDATGALLDPVVERFCEELHAVAESRPELGAKCEDLERRLREFAASLAEPPEWDGEIPF